MANLFHVIQTQRNICIYREPVVSYSLYQLDTPTIHYTLYIIHYTLYLNIPSLTLTLNIKSRLLDLMVPSHLLTIESPRYILIRDLFLTPRYHMGILRRHFCQKGSVTVFRCCIPHTVFILVCIKYTISNFANFK